MRYYVHGMSLRGLNDRGNDLTDERDKAGKPIDRTAMMDQRDLTEAHVPVATYRLQFNRSFTFHDATQLVPYLAELGVSHVYASPFLKARSGSTHGYDICDHSQLNPEIGSAEDFAALCDALRERRMGLILDVVPNHMSIGEPSNTWWTDVLENGPSSVYAHYFDIEWFPNRRRLENRVLLPILEDQYGRVLEQGKIQLAFEDGTFTLYYYQTKLPVSPDSYHGILSEALATLIEALGEGDESVLELQSIITALGYLPGTTERATDRVEERHREKEVIKRRLAVLWGSSLDVRSAIEKTVRAFNGTIGDARAFDHLDALLDLQCYRLAYWRVASEEINYRRFFDVNELAAIRVEHPQVFDATHELIFRLLGEAKVIGLRVDHPDGLWDPSGYFRQVQDRFRELASSGAGETPLYVVAEKILTEGERLPDDWAVAGTTGYDFLNLVNGLFVDAGNRKAFDRIYRDFTGERVSFRELVNSSKKMIMLVSLASEVNALANQLARVADVNRLYRDFTLNSLTFAIREVIAALSVYRTYTVGLADAVADRDQAYIRAAVREAKKRNPRTAESIFDFIRDLLLLRNVEDFSEEDHAKVQEFVMKFQQISSPVMAKGVEDTAFYVFNRLVSLNEVGGNPDQFGVPIETFHQRNLDRLRRWPHSMLATSTHDTKRAEDVRARVNVLSEIPREWRTVLARWSRLNARKKTEVDGELAPCRNDEYLLYQTLVGAWPSESLDGDSQADFRGRIVAFMLKATKEAKTHTSWINPNQGYDEAVTNFVLRLLPDGSRDVFLSELRAFVKRVAFFGRFNSLAQTLLKCTAPGVPDVYQGTELWDGSLTDPDNRRPVSYMRRVRRLTDLKEEIAAARSPLPALTRRLTDDSEDGTIKLFVISVALGFRRAHVGLFAEGDYEPLDAAGAKAEHVVAFARARGGETAIVVVPRLVVGLTAGAEQPPLDEPVWGDTWLFLPSAQPGQQFRDVFTGVSFEVDTRDGRPGLPVAAILGHFPVALLASP